MGPKLRTKKKVGRGAAGSSTPRTQQAKSPQHQPQFPTASSPTVSAMQSDIPQSVPEESELILECPDFRDRWYCKNGSLCPMYHDYALATPERLSCQIDSVTADLSILHRKMDQLLSAIFGSR